MAAVALAMLPMLAVGQRQQPMPPQLEMRAYLTRDASRVAVTWVNSGEAPFLVNLGSLIGSTGVAPGIKMSIQGSELPNGDLLDTTQSGIVGGRAEALIVCLPPNAEYTVSLRTEHLWLPDHKRKLKDLLDRPWKVTVSYVAGIPFHVTPDGRRIPFDVIRDYPD